MDGEAYFEAAASLSNHYSWEASPKHVISIEVGKELNHRCKAKDPSRDIETDLVDKRFRTQMAPEHVPNQERQRLMATEKEFVRKLADET